VKILDRYILKKFFGTFAFMLALLSVIVIVIDVQSKAPRIESSGYTVSYFLLHFYPYWMIYLIITFMSILVFISVIYFTSRIANNTEIVAYISSGASFHRFARPYLVCALAIAGFALVTNHFLLPWANIKKNELIIYTLAAAKKNQRIENQQISTQLSPNEYLFINSYNKQSNRGSGYLYQKFDKNRKLIEQITATEIAWDEKRKAFVINNYLQRTSLPGDKEKLASGGEKIQDFKSTPTELFPDELLGENKTTPELIRFIDRERSKGNAAINTYENELHQRSSMPVSIVILTFLALALASEKKRGGLGANLAIGISLAFVFVFSFEALKVVSAGRTLSPAVAMWMPNIVFGPLAAFLYLKRANQ